MSLGAETVVGELHRTVVDIVGSPAEKGGWPGIYTTRLPPRPFVQHEGGGGWGLVLSTQWGLDKAAVLVDVGTGSVQRLSELGVSVAVNVVLSCRERTDIAGEATTEATTEAMPLHSSAVIGIASSPLTSPWVFRMEVGDLKGDLKGDHHPTHPLSVPALDLSREMQVESFAGDWGEYLILTPALAPAGHEATAEAAEAAEATAETTAARAALPMVVFPHGGPHSSFATSWMPGPSLLVLHGGFGLVFANYRGSTGQGEDALNSLPGQIGTNDVADCLAMMDDANARGYGTPAAQWCVVGGSHGGFLSCQLTSQPQCCDRFRATAMRNPVTDLTTMIGTSDIEDWVAFEGGVGENFPDEAVVAAGGVGTSAFGRGLREEDVARLWRRSPMSTVSNVTCRSLILLGADDLRVPPTQGKQWARQLRTRGKEVACVIYPDNNHPLAAPFANYDVWVRSVEWLQIGL